MKQKQGEHFEHLGFFVRVVISLFKMQIRDCNKPGDIDVVTNDREWCHFLDVRKCLLVCSLFWEL